MKKKIAIIFLSALTLLTAAGTFATIMEDDRLLVKKPCNMGNQDCKDMCADLKEDPFAEFKADCHGCCEHVHELAPRKIQACYERCLDGKTTPCKCP